MGAYLIRRLLLVIPTLWAIITINFFIVQIAPGGPVDQAIAAIEFGNAGVLPGAGGEGVRASHAQTGVGNISDSNYRGGRGLDPEVIAEITHRYGFDKPIHERYFKMLWDYIRFDFGDSLFRSASVLTLIKDSLPVSITLGLWSTLIIYLVSIPLGIRKAVYNGSRFDVWSSAFIIIGYAIPAFLFAILLIVFFAGGSYFDLFPLRGLVSANFDSLPWYQKITDYLWHITLPVLATVIGGFAALTMLTKNSFLDEVRKQYVVTARAKGVSEKNILWKHVFRNAMLLVIAGFPATFISMFFTGSLLIEVMFSLNGLGLLGYEATVSRDYPVMFGTLYIFTLIGLLLNIVSDIQKLLTSLPAHHFQIVLEITERDMLKEQEATQLFAWLHSVGVEIAIDDFGTGHSALIYLERFTLDYLKIDRGFINAIGTETITSPVLDAVLTLAKRLNMLTVAEGVETPEQARWLSERGVNFMQGYWISRPLPLDDFVRWLKKPYTPQW